MQIQDHADSSQYISPLRIKKGEGVVVVVIVVIVVVVAIVLLIVAVTVVDGGVHVRR